MRDVRQSALLVLCLLLFANGCERYKVPLTGSEASILLFDGVGASSNDVAAIESLLRSNRQYYSRANSSELNNMSASQLRRYRLLIVPGGDFIAIGKGLTPETAAKIRSAVQDGTNYLGICAGAFFAGSLTGYNSLNLTSGAKFGFYSAEAKGVRKTAVAITIPGGSAQDQYWEDGPQLSGWGSAVARYPDGTPAIAEGTFGKGWVLLTGIHSEAPESWRRGMSFSTPVEADRDYAYTLIQSALNGEPLPHY